MPQSYVTEIQTWVAEKAVVPQPQQFQRHFKQLGRRTPPVALSSVETRSLTTQPLAMNERCMQQTFLWLKVQLSSWKASTTKQTQRTELGLLTKIVVSCPTSTWRCSVYKSTDMVSELLNSPALSDLSWFHRFSLPKESSGKILKQSAQKPAYFQKCPFL